MALNKSCAGKTYPPVASEVTGEAIAKYARACNDDNPAYFEPAHPGGIIAPPLFSVVPAWLALLGVVGDPELQVDLLHLLHSEQDMEFLGPIRPGDTITSRARIASLETRPGGETLTVALEAHNQDAQPVGRMLFGAFIRTGGGGRTGDGEQRSPKVERGEPLFAVSQVIDPDQSLRYAQASGDRNPIHTDEAVARMAGLRGPILHGLCTMAFGARVIVERPCAGEPTRLRRLRVRFARPVYPGQTITTRVWDEGRRNGRRLFSYETFNPDGRAVIREGLAEVQD